jgi:hypothetical protein
MRAAMRELNLRHRTDLPMDEIARQINPLLRGWIEYYGRYAPSALYPLLRYVNQMLLRWARRKFRRFKAHKIRASRFLQAQAQKEFFQPCTRNSLLVRSMASIELAMCS